MSGAGPGCTRRGAMACPMGLCQTGFGWIGAMQRVRCVERRRAAGANAGTDQNQSKCPNAGRNHPASILSPTGVSCRASPFGDAHFMPILHSMSGAVLQIGQARRLRAIRPSSSKRLPCTGHERLPWVHRPYRPLRMQRKVPLADKAHSYPDATTGPVRSQPPPNPAVEFFQKYSNCRLGCLALSQEPLHLWG